MQIDALDAVFQTILFVTVLVPVIVFTIRKTDSTETVSYYQTNELKGVAVLMIVFSHIGYFLFSDHKFLYPLSVAGGVGVNIFLFLSGFGLTTSQNTSKTSVMKFYVKRLKNIFVPMWVVLVLILLLDNYLLARTYNLKTIVQSFFGFFPNSDINSAINSPLWYFSLILFYYLLFPLVYSKRMPLLSICIILLSGFLVTRLPLPVTVDVLKLYKLHFLAFPLGMAFAYISKVKVSVDIFSRYFLIFLLSILFVYTAIHSGVGKNVITEQLISLVSMSALVLIFLLKNFQSNLLITLGKYSYEIYLIQWPLMYRFDFIYKHTPAFLGTLLYIGLFLVFGFVLKRVSLLVMKTLKL